MAGRLGGVLVVFGLCSFLVTSCGANQLMDEGYPESQPVASSLATTPEPAEVTTPEPITVTMTLDAMEQPAAPMMTDERGNGSALEADASEGQPMSSLPPDDDGTPGGEQAAASDAPLDGDETVVVLDPAPEPEDAVGIALTDLGARLGVDPSTIAVVSVDEVVWADASLGCPEAGVAYAQMLVPGLRIVLSAAGADYEYHSGQGRAPFLCDNPREPAAER